MRACIRNWYAGPSETVISVMSWEIRAWVSSLRSTNPLVGAVSRWLSRCQSGPSNPRPTPSSNLRRCHRSICRTSLSCKCAPMIPGARPSTCSNADTISSVTGTVPFS